MINFHSFTDEMIKIAVGKDVAYNKAMEDYKAGRISKKQFEAAHNKFMKGMGRTSWGMPSFG